MHRIDLGPLSWKFRKTGGAKWMPATVPGCVHRDLLANKCIEDPFWGRNELDLQWIGQGEWEYQVAFPVSSSLLEEERVELVAEGLDTIASVYLNDERLGGTDNMFVSHRWDLRSSLKRKNNKLRIVFHSAEEYIKNTRKNHHPQEFNDPVGRCTVIRKQQCQFGWDWGPRLITAGIWRPIRIEAWSTSRIERLHITQEHSNENNVSLILAPKLSSIENNLLLNAHLHFEGELIAEISENGQSEKLVLDVRNPKIWWPSGQGAQPLYTLSIDLVNAKTGEVIDHCRRRIGLRTTTLNRQRDEFGESFRFIVNGRPVFAKGSNWIPAHSFVAGLQRKDYERDLKAAVSANMNMVRVWGGGIYESEDFYDICDELGLMVWQDFMFACSLYPYDEAFVKSVQLEASQQVARLQHRASLALWCGNNELPQINKSALHVPAVKAGYEKIFHHALPSTIARFDGVTSYWPSSEWRGRFDTFYADGEKSGDTHFWNVWHQRVPVQEYERWKFRFCSEYGMQSYASQKTQKTFCDPAKDNIFGPVMENHQKHVAGNQIILDYVFRRYRYPKDQEGIVYLSQLNQAHCLSYATEYYRRIMPRCMGALYWQLNDCWPVASWSSIEFTGNWKALHYAARRFFSPTIASGQVVGCEEVTIGNYRRPASGKVHLYTVCDAQHESAGTLFWELRTLEGGCLDSGSKRVFLRPGESILQKKLDYKKQCRQEKIDNRIYLRMFLIINENIVSENTLFFTEPRFLDLEKAATKVSLRRISREVHELGFTSPVYQHGFVFGLGKIENQASDNFFDLYPGVEKHVQISVSPEITQNQIKKAITSYSLVNSYK